jgi:hypothetical protein
MTGAGRSRSHDGRRRDLPVGGPGGDLTIGVDPDRGGRVESRSPSAAALRPAFGVREGPPGRRGALCARPPSSGMPVRRFPRAPPMSAAPRWELVETPPRGPERIRRWSQGVPVKSDCRRAPRPKEPLPPAGKSSPARGVRPDGPGRSSPARSVVDPPRDPSIGELRPGGEGPTRTETPLPLDPFLPLRGGFPATPLGHGTDSSTPHSRIRSDRLKRGATASWRRGRRRRRSGDRGRPTMAAGRSGGSGPLGRPDGPAPAPGRREPCRGPPVGRGAGDPVRMRPGLPRGGLRPSPLGAERSR